MRVRHKLLKFVIVIFYLDDNNLHINGVKRKREKLRFKKCRSIFEFQRFSTKELIKSVLMGFLPVSW